MPVAGELPFDAPVIAQVSVVVLLIVGLVVVILFRQPATRLCVILAGHVTDGPAQVVTVIGFDAKAVLQLLVTV